MARAPVRGSMPIRFRTRKSPRSGSSCSVSIAMPRKSEWLARVWSSELIVWNNPRKASTAGRSSSSMSMFWSHRVMRMTGPTGRQPWATMASTAMFPCRATPMAPEPWTWSPRKRALPPGRWAPLASPPILMLAVNA